MPGLIRILFPAVTACAVLAATVACSNGDRSNAPVPKPDAWPRIGIPPEEYTVHQFNKVSFPLNSEATVTSREKDGGVWIDISYPTFHNTRLYLTLLQATSSENLTEILDNRRERMELNSGGAVTEITELTSEGGWECMLALTHSSVTTPLQILAHDGRNVISGSLYFNFPPSTNPDSVSPIVDAVNRDLIHTLKNIRTQ